MCIRDRLQGLVNDKDADRQLELVKIQLQAEKDIRVAQINAESKADVEELKGVVSLLTQHMGNLQAVEQMVPPEWMETEEYDQELPEHELPPQHEMDEPPPMPSENIENPAESEQGFLMPEETAQNLAPETDLFGDSVSVNDMEQPNANDGQY